MVNDLFGACEGAAQEKPKRCCECKRTLPRSEFYRARTRSDGLTTVCKPCNAALARRYRRNHLEKVRAREAADRERNRDKKRESVRKAYAKNVAKYDAQRRERYQRERAWFRAKARIYYVEHPGYRDYAIEKAKRHAIAYPAARAVRQRKWYHANLDRLRVQGVLLSNKRRALVRGAGARFTAEEWAATLTYFGDCCAYCLKHQSALGKKLTVDHVMPISRKGLNSAENIVPACVTCNKKKGTRTPLEFFAGLPRLMSTTR